jgi:ribosomal-protein-alanine N-acetyltransferase
MEVIKLTGKSTYLVPFTKKHLTEKYVSWLNNGENVRYSNQQFLKHSLQSGEDFLNSFSGGQNLFMAIHSLENNEHIGTITAYLTAQHRIADVGILIGEPSSWGKGLGLDAWEVMMNYLFEKKNVRKVTAGTVKPNIGMIRIMEKSGMSLEAIRPRHLVYNGKEEDVLLYAKFAQA